MPTDLSYYVYVIFFLDGEPCYVGKGKGNRWKSHKKGSHNLKIKRLFQKNEDLPICIIREALSNEDASTTEIALIKAIGRLDNNEGPLLNQTNGGDGAPGWKHTEESLAKIRGRSLTAEHKAKLSLAKLGKPGRIWTQEQRVQISSTKKTQAPSEKQQAAWIRRKGQLGKPASIETKRKMSQSQRGRKDTQKARDNKKNAAILRFSSETERQKISVSLIGNTNCLGRKHSLETRQKISIAAIEREQRKLNDRAVA